MRRGQKVTVAGWVLAITLLGVGAAQADPTAGSLVVPPESIGAQTFSYNGAGDPYAHYFQWPNYLSEVREGAVWHLDVLGIDASGITGPDGRAARFQLYNVIPIGGTIWDGSPQQWTSLMFNVKLYDAGNALFQLQESYQVTPTMPFPDWYGLRSQSFDVGELTVDHFDLRMELSKAAGGDPWTVTPYYRLDGGDWIAFGGGAVSTNNSWDFGSRVDGYIWPDYGGTMFDIGFTSSGQGTFSIDNARIYAIPAPPAVALTLLGLGIASRIRRRPKA